MLLSAHHILYPHALLPTPKGPAVGGYNSGSMHTAREHSPRPQKAAARPCFTRGNPHRHRSSTLEQSPPMPKEPTPMHERQPAQVKKWRPPRRELDQLPPACRKRHHHSRKRFKALTRRIAKKKPPSSQGTQHRKLECLVAASASTWQPPARPQSTSRTP